MDNLEISETKLFNNQIYRRKNTLVLGKNLLKILQKGKVVY